jgi:hypothetical protein
MIAFLPAPKQRAWTPPRLRALTGRRPRAYKPSMNEPAGAIKPNTFFCLDGHTCGNPVRLVAGGGPPLAGATMT